MTIKDYRQHMKIAKRALGAWAIVALQDGKVAVSGYNYDVKTGTFPKIAILIMKLDKKEEKNEEDSVSEKEEYKRVRPGDRSFEDGQRAWS